VKEEGGWTEKIRLEGNVVRKRFSLTYLVWFSSQVHWLRMEASSSVDTRMRSGFSCHGLLYFLLYSVIQKDGLSFVSLYFLNCIWYVN